jgi:hypothetical protein
MKLEKGEKEKFTGIWQTGKSEKLFIFLTTIFL